MSLEISTDSTRLDLGLIHRFLSNSYWAEGRTLEEVERSVRHSLCFGAFENNQQCGFARVVTDRVTFAYLADVFVLPEYQGRGIAKALLRSIIDNPDLRAVKVMLLRTRDAHRLYAQFGFTDIGQPERFMWRRPSEKP